MERMENILTLFRNSSHSVDELIVMYDDFTFDAEAVFFAIGMLLSSNKEEELKYETDTVLTLG
jgi:hypothetical protein